MLEIANREDLSLATILQDAFTQSMNMRVGITSRHFLVLREEKKDFVKLLELLQKSVKSIRDS